MLLDPDVQSIVPWPLAEIGDRRAIAPLLDVLGRDNPSMRIISIGAVDRLHAREALPALHAPGDDRRATFGEPITVADAGSRAIASLSGPR